MVWEILRQTLKEQSCQNQKRDEKVVDNFTKETAEIKKKQEEGIPNQKPSR